MTDQLEQPTRGRGRRSNRARRLGLMRRSGLLLVLLAIGALLASTCSRTSGPGTKRWCPSGFVRLSLLLYGFFSE